MTPEQIAKPDTEYAHQCAVMAWASSNIGKYPELKWYYSIQNEEKSNSAFVGGRARASGKKAGVSDTCLPVKRGGFSGLYIEMKKPSRKPKRKGSLGGVSEEQLEFGRFIQSQGFGFIVCYSWEEARDILIQYLEQKEC